MAAVCGERLRTGTSPMRVHASLLLPKSGATVAFTVDAAGAQQAHARERQSSGSDPDGERSAASPRGRRCDLEELALLHLELVFLYP